MQDLSRMSDKLQFVAQTVPFSRMGEGYWFIFKMELILLDLSDE